MVNVDAEGGFHGVRACLDQQPVNSSKLLSRHPKNPPVVGDSAEKHTPARVGEGCHLVGKVLWARARWAVPTEFELLELPTARLASP